MAKRGDIDWIADIVKIFQSGQLKVSIDNLTQSIRNLQGSLFSLNSMMITQNDQVKESIKQAKENVEELRKEFEKLNQEMGKSNAYFERMYRSSEIMENLTTVLTIFTVLIFAVGLYPVLKDYQLESGNTQSSYVVFLIALLISIFAMLFFTFLIPMIRKNKIVFLIVSILAILFLMFSIH